jgi:hypothetical protein
MTQTDRVLAALTRAGATGITQVDFTPPVVVDGGKPILRVGARIHELREAGFNIQNHGTRNQCAVYVLADRPVAPNGRPDPQLSPNHPAMGNLTPEEFEESGYDGPMVVQEELF